MLKACIAVRGTEVCAFGQNVMRVKQIAVQGVKPLPTEGTPEYDVALGDHERGVHDELETSAMRARG